MKLVEIYQSIDFFLKYQIFLSLYIKFSNGILSCIQETYIIIYRYLHIIIFFELFAVFKNSYMNYIFKTIEKDIKNNVFMCKIVVFFQENIFKFFNHDNFFQIQVIINIVCGGPWCKNQKFFPCQERNLFFCYCFCFKKTNENETRIWISLRSYLLYFTFVLFSFELILLF